MARIVRLAWSAFCVAVVAMWLGAPVQADDAYFRVPLDKIEALGGKMPAAEVDPRGGFVFFTNRSLQSHVVLDHEGDAYVRGRQRFAIPGQALDGWELTARVPANRDLSGRLIFIDTTGRALPPVRFKIARDLANAQAKEAFWQARLDYYDYFVQQGMAGAAWFRHQALEAAAELGVNRAATDNNPQGPRNRSFDQDRALDLFAGNRAFAENLSLDRQMASVYGGKATVAADALRGITIAEIDWKPLLPPDRPALDPLASLLPADQHALLLPSFAALVRINDEMRSFGNPLTQVFSPSGQDSRLVERYQRQMGVSLNAASRLLGPALVRSVAITGGDPYFELGTDVAVVLESPEPAVLSQAIVGMLQLTLANVQGATRREGQVGPIAYAGFASDDRLVSGYVFELPGAVVVTNSLSQIQRFAKVRQDPERALALLDEFHYFRHRYPLGDADETGFLFISDATIRRWCGPRWRIAAMRRAQAMAEIAERQAQIVQPLVAGIDPVLPRATRPSTIELGEVTVDRHGARASIYGSLDFATPLSELPLDLVTSLEADAYDRWRQAYERSWRWAFDPIGLRLSVTETRIAGDLTILPLIANTEYRPLIDLTRGAAIPFDAGDPHGAIVHGIMALNHQKSMWLSLVRNFAQSTVKRDPGKWMGPTIALYVDDSPLWDELDKAFEHGGEHERELWLRRNVRRIPLAVLIDVTDRDEAKAFLKAVREYLDDEAKNLQFQWEDLEYRGQPYTRMCRLERVLEESFVLHVAVLDKFAIFAVSEETLKRAIDRQQQRHEKPAENAAPAKPDASRVTWAGRNAALEVDRRAIWTAWRLGGTTQIQRMQERSWSNLPVLNEWKRLFPDRDPVQVHEQLWNVRLVCPCGGQYVWNQEALTMESTVLGHPAQPKQPPRDALLARELIERARFQLTFENQGLRAEVSVDRGK